ncbi:unnamed protein product [Arctogadus glacialis]
MDSDQDGISAPFSDPVYLKAAALDPVFSFQWVEPHVMVTPDVKEQVAEKVKDLILKDAAAEFLRGRTFVEEEDMEDHSAVQQYGLFAAYRKRPKKDSVDSPALQLSHHLDKCEGQNALLFWAMNESTLPSLFPVAMRVLTVPASSAPVERVFSHGGIILRPHRSQMSDTLLSKLIFFKCNLS